MTMIEPLSKRRAAEMKDVRAKATKGDKAAAAKLRRICRRGMLSPYWER